MALNGNDFLEYLHYSLTLITVGRVNVNQTCDLISEKHLPTLLFNNLVILMLKNKQASKHTNKQTNKKPLGLRSTYILQV